MVWRGGVLVLVVLACLGGMIALVLTQLFREPEIPPLPRREALRLAEILVVKGRNRTPERSLPHLVHRTGPLPEPELPTGIRSRHNRTLDKLGSSYKQVYYDDQDCAELIRKNFPEIVEEAFYLLQGASRADLARLCILWVKGGIYLDLSYEVLDPHVGSAANENRLLLARDRLRKGKDGIQFGVLSARPGEPLLLHAVAAVVAAVFSSLPGGIRASTGPTMFWGVIQRKAPALLQHAPLRQVGDGSIAWRDGRPAISMYGPDHRVAVPKSYDASVRHLELTEPTIRSPRVRYLLGPHAGAGPPPPVPVGPVLHGVGSSRPWAVAAAIPGSRPAKYHRDAAVLARAAGVRSVRFHTGDHRDPTLMRNWRTRGDYITKWRELGGYGALTPLNWHRHFKWMQRFRDRVSFEAKSDSLFWRGATTGDGLRLRFVRGLAPTMTLGSTGSYRIKTTGSLSLICDHRHRQKRSFLTDLSSS